MMTHLNFLEPSAVHATLAYDVVACGKEDGEERNAAAGTASYTFPWRLRLGRIRIPKPWLFNDILVLSFHVLGAQIQLRGCGCAVVS
jgi:hypothetical protein